MQMRRVHTPEDVLTFIALFIAISHHASFYNRTVSFFLSIACLSKKKKKKKKGTVPRTFTISVILRFLSLDGSLIIIKFT